MPSNINVDFIFRTYFSLRFFFLCCQAEWKGVTQSQDGKEHSFSANLVVDIIRVIGNGEDEMGAFTIDGERTSETKVQFVKRYGGHSMKYVGELSPDKRNINGTYAGEGATGSFKMTRQDSIE